MAKFLVTGGAGFIGSNLADELAKSAENEVTVVDNLSTGFKDYVTSNGKIKFIKADVNDFNDISGVFYSGQFDYVYHYAAVVGVYRTLSNPVSVLRDIDGIKNILCLCKNTSVRRIFFASSSEVYGEPIEMPQNEQTTPLNSRLPYAIVKNIGEAFLRSYEQEYGLSFTIFRFFNTYGPRQSADFVMSKFLDAAINGEDITIYGDGSQSRTFCHVSDNIEATTNAINEEIAVNEVLNIGNDSEIKIIDLANEVVRIAQSKSKIVHLPPLKEGDMTRRQPDVTRMKELLHRDFIPLEEGIKSLLEYKKNQR